MNIIQIIVSNNIRIRGATTPLRAAVTAALTLDNPQVVAKLKKRQPIWGLERKLTLYVQDGQDLITPRGFINDLKEILRKQGIDPEKVIAYRQVITDNVDFGSWNELYKLRDYQLPAVEAVVSSGSGGVVVAPAGSGKTIIGLKVTQEIRQPTLWLTHTQDLMYQTAKKASEVLENVGNVGIIGDGKVAYGSGKLTVALVQALAENPKIIEGLKPLIGMLVIDEAHHFPAPAFVDIAGQFPAAKMLGLTATPDRKDFLECYMFRGIGPKLHTIARDGLYDAGALIKPEVKFCYTDFSYEQGSDRNHALDNVDAGGEDLDYRALLDALIADEKRAKMIAQNILDNAPGNYSIVLTESVRYCYVLRDLVTQFAKANWGVVPRMAVIHGPLSRYKWLTAKNEKDAQAKLVSGVAKDLKYDEGVRRWKVKVENYTAEEFSKWQIRSTDRQLMLKMCGDKKIDILFATQLAREGLDMPHLTIGHSTMPKRGDAAGSANGASTEQEVGRIMRKDPTNPNKQAVWFDYVDYDVGVFRSQYQSRRSVYKRLGIALPNKPKTETQKMDDWLGSIPY